MPLNLLEKAADLFGCELYVFFEENVSEDMILATAFRIEDLNRNDLQEIIHFKDIVKSYIKMDQHFQLYAGSITGHSPTKLLKAIKSSYTPIDRDSYLKTLKGGGERNAKGK